jgi:hypothetical protein
MGLVRQVVMMVLYRLNLPARLEEVQTLNLGPRAVVYQRRGAAAVVGHPLLPLLRVTLGSRRMELVLSGILCWGLVPVEIKIG